MKKAINSILKVTKFTVSLIGTLVQTALFGSFIHGDKYSDILQMHNL